MADDDRKNIPGSWLNTMPSDVKRNMHNRTWKFTKSELEVLRDALNCHMSDDYPLDYSNTLFSLLKRIEQEIKKC
jgi:hypothetical protein